LAKKGEAEAAEDGVGGGLEGWGKVARGGGGKEPEKKEKKKAGRASRLAEAEAYVGLLRRLAFCPSYFLSHSNLLFKHISSFMLPFSHT